MPDLGGSSQHDKHRDIGRGANRGHHSLLNPRHRRQQYKRLPPPLHVATDPRHSTHAMLDALLLASTARRALRAPRSTKSTRSHLALAIPAIDGPQSTVLSARDLRQVRDREPAQVDPPGYEPSAGRPGHRLERNGHAPRSHWSISAARSRSRSARDARTHDRTIASAAPLPSGSM